MKKVILAALIVSTAFACKKSTATKTDAPVKYYFKIQPVELDGTKNTNTTYKIITVY